MIISCWAIVTVLVYSSSSGELLIQRWQKLFWCCARNSTESNVPSRVHGALTTYAFRARVCISNLGLNAKIGREDAEFLQTTEFLRNSIYLPKPIVFVHLLLLVGKIWVFPDHVRCKRAVHDHFSAETGE